MNLEQINLMVAEYNQNPMEFADVKIFCHAFASDGVVVSSSLYCHEPGGSGTMNEPIEIGVAVLEDPQAAGQLEELLNDASERLSRKIGAALGLPVPVPMEEEQSLAEEPKVETVNEPQPVSNVGQEAEPEPVAPEGDAAGEGEESHAESEQA